MSAFRQDKFNNFVWQKRNSGPEDFFPPCPGLGLDSDSNLFGLGLDLDSVLTWTRLVLVLDSSWTRQRWSWLQPLCPHPINKRWIEQVTWQIVTYSIRSSLLSWQKYEMTPPCWVPTMAPATAPLRWKTHYSPLQPTVSPLELTLNCKPDQIQASEERTGWNDHVSRDKK